MTARVLRKSRLKDARDLQIFANMIARDVLTNSNRKAVDARGTSWKHRPVTQVETQNTLSMMVLEFSRELGSIAGNDFDRARWMADRFQLPEMRLMALLQIAQGGLNTDGQ